eukprot:3344512-Pyramimonas_sp.AAC.1
MRFSVDCEPDARGMPKAAGFSSKRLGPENMDDAWQRGEAPHICIGSLRDAGTQQRLLSRRTSGGGLELDRAAAAECVRARRGPRARWGFVLFHGKMQKDMRFPPRNSPGS